jgi:HSP20 family protein
MQRALQRTLDDVWHNASTTEAAALPVRLDVREDEKAFHVMADLPGLNESEVEVTFDDGLLTIRGDKKIERDEKKDTWHVIERSRGSFARRLTLSANIDADKIDAKFEKGVLNITLPKVPAEQTAAKKITIKAA